jgi:hypothetical protein
MCLIALRALALAAALSITALASQHGVHQMGVGQDTNQIAQYVKSDEAEYIANQDMLFRTNLQPVAVTSHARNDHGSSSDWSVLSAMSNMSIRDSTSTLSPANEFSYATNSTTEPKSYPQTETTTNMSYESPHGQSQWPYSTETGHKGRKPSPVLSDRHIKATSGRSEKLDSSK